MTVRACICDEHLKLSDDGVLGVRSGAFGPRLVLRYTASAQFRKASYPWLSKVFVRVQAGGGAGGGTATTSATEAAAGGGGGGGGYAEALVDVAALADVELVTVGTGGVAAAGARGGDGGFSAFGGHCVATAGSGGGLGSENPNAFLAVSANGFPGAAGRGTVGDVLYLGGLGGVGFTMGSTAMLAKAGHGGSSRFAGRAAGRVSSGAGVAAAANTGQGGGGACGRTAHTQVAGGVGGSGLIVLDLYG